MSFEKSAPPSVMERFPDASHVVDEQYRSNVDFRELVDHFDECEGVLAQLMSRSDFDRARVDEYQTLLAELREEIAMALSALSKDGAHRSL